MKVLLILMLAFVGTAEANCAHAKHIANYNGAVAIEHGACIDYWLLQVHRTGTSNLVFLVDWIKYRGYTCDSVSEAVFRSTSERAGIYFECDGFTNGYFAYEHNESILVKPKEYVKGWDDLPAWESYYD